MDESDIVPTQIFDDFMDAETCARWCAYIDKNTNGQRMLSNSVHTRELEPLVRSLLPETIEVDGERWRFAGLSSCITLSKHTAPFAIKPHRDGTKHEQREGKMNLLKLFIFLNDGDGGNTEMLRSRDDHTVVETIARRRGRAAVFDIRRWHRGGENRAGVKYLLGMRPLFVRAD
jgi:hypothetical protein